MVHCLGRSFSLALLAATFLSVGCNRAVKRPSTTAAPTSTLARGTAPSKPLVIPESKPKPVLASEDDPAQLIPAPPNLAALQGEKSLTPAPIPPLPEKSNDLLPVSIRRETPANDIESLHRKAVSKYGQIDSFEARLTRREVVQGREQPLEVLMFQFRKAPLSVRMKWIGTEGQGREVLFVQGKYEDKMQILPARSDTFPIPPFKVAYAPDDPTIQAKSRHDIRQAGLSEAINHLGDVLKKGDLKRFRYLGQVARKEYATPMDGIEEIIPPNEERGLPKGGKRLYFFDATPNAPSEGLPVLVIAHDERNREVEYYCFDRFLFPAKLDETDFDVRSLGAKR